MTIGVSEGEIEVRRLRGTGLLLMRQKYSVQVHKTLALLSTDSEAVNLLLIVVIQFAVVQIGMP